MYKHTRCNNTENLLYFGCLSQSLNWTFGLRHSSAINLDKLVKNNLYQNNLLICLRYKICESFCSLDYVYIIYVYFGFTPGKRGQKNYQFFCVHDWLKIT